MVDIGLVNVERLRTVEWSKSWLWSLMFPEGPEPFTTWFPATEISVNDWSLQTKSIATAFTEFALPLKTSKYSLKVTFIDDIHLSISEWLEHWVNEEILLGGTGVASLVDIVKHVRIAKLDNRKRVVYMNVYEVFPEGEYMYDGTSAAGNHSNAVDFVIAGTVSTQRFNPPVEVEL